MAGPARRRILLTVAALALAAAGAIALLPTAVPPPDPPALAPAPLVPPPVPAPPPPTEPPPVPIASPEPVPAGPPLQTIHLRDGRCFIGLHDAEDRSFTVAAALRGGRLTRMPAIRIPVAPEDIADLAPYDGHLGDLAATYIPPPPDPQRSADLEQARAAAAERAEQRRQEAAERERLRLQAAQHAEAVRRADGARTAVAAARERIRLLTTRGPTLETDRRLKLELRNGLQLQINAARDRWNLEVQDLGPRVVRPDGTPGGGPTLATETLVAQLARQIRDADAAVAALEAALRNETAERLALEASLPRLEDESRQAETALAALAP